MGTLRKLAAALCLGAATVCGAATSDGWEVRAIPDATVAWDAVGYSIVFFLVTLAVAFKNAKRTHLD